MSTSENTTDLSVARAVATYLRSDRARALGDRVDAFFQANPFWFEGVAEHRPVTVDLIADMLDVWALTTVPAGTEVGRG